MTDLLNPALALLTLVLGGFGFLAPRYTADVLDLVPQPGTMGLSELRASAGGLFVALGAFCLLSGAGAAYFMLGVAYAGAAAGRALSLLLDAPPRRKAALYLAFEAGPAAWLLTWNAAAFASTG